MAPPNIVLILTDDMGFSDIGCYGSEIPTPRLDALAANGVRLTQMYNGARCCPTRASLLTGLYPHQAGIGHMTHDRGHPGYRGHLNDRCLTIAEALRNAGYRTFMSGKWHVGGIYGGDPQRWRQAGEPGYPRPIDRGFDHHFGTLEGAGNYFNPFTLVNDGQFISALDPDFYYTDAIGAHAAGAVRRYAHAGQPFFIYAGYTAPHWPLHARPEEIEPHRGRYLKGWDELRGERWERMKDSGVLSSRWHLSPRDDKAPAWEDAPDKEWEDARMAVYAAQIASMDRSVGAILDAIDGSGLTSNTLVMFLSDNGGCAELLRENGDRRPDFINRTTRDGHPVQIGNSRAVQPGGEDTFMSYDLPWANASNTPFRLYKHWVHEGGISTPFIASWPGVIPPGGIVHEPCNVIDVMPTCLDAATASYPEEHNDVVLTSLGGESLLPVFKSERFERKEPIFWEHEGNRAVRQGRWKLVSKHPGPWELYDIDEDRTELEDLAEREPAMVQELSGLYDAWATRSDVLPWPVARATL